MPASRNPWIHVRAKRELEELPDTLTERVKETVSELCEQREIHSHPGVKPLAGTDNLFRLRVGDARAVCCQDGSDVLIIRCGLRDTVYRGIDTEIPNRLAVPD